MPRHPDFLQVTFTKNHRIAPQWTGQDFHADFDPSGQLTVLGLNLPGFEAVALHHDLSQLANITKGREIYDLAYSVYMQFERAGRFTDFDIAIQLFREVLALQPRQAPALVNLGNMLLTRFIQSPGSHSLDEAISLHRDALKQRPPLHPDRPLSLCLLGNTLCAQFLRSGQYEDLGEAILLFHEALQSVSSFDLLRSMILQLLAFALLARFRQSGQRNDLNEAISLYRDAAGFFVNGQCLAFHGLAGALCTRFEQSGQRDDLYDAILYYRDALHMRPLPNHHRSDSLTDLASMLVSRFQWSGQREDLDDAISLFRDVLELRPPSHPYRDVSLGNLSRTLLIKYTESGQRENLDESILLGQEVLKLQPSSHQDRPLSLIILATGIEARSEESGQLEDQEHAISLFRHALELQSSPQPGQLVCLYALGCSLGRQFSMSNQHKDMDEAILLLREGLKFLLSLDAFQSGDDGVLQHLVPSHYRLLSTLANMLAIRSGWSSQHEDLDEAINIYHQCIKTLTSEHHQVCLISARFGVSLMKAHSYNNDSQYLNKAKSAFQTAVKCTGASAFMRFRVAQVWQHFVDSIHELALEAYCAAIELLPWLAMPGLDMQSRHQALRSGTDGLARDAAACAIQLEQYERAIELLEQGRAVFWSQILQLQTSMDDLHDMAPILEQELKKVSFKLEQGSLCNIFRDFIDVTHKVISMEQEESYFRHLNKKWLIMVEKVQQIHSFHDFFHPSPLSTLQNAAANGPIIILNASKGGCAALVLTSTGVQSVPLLKLTFTEVTTLAKLIKSGIAPNTLVIRSNRAYVEGLVQQMPLLSDNLKLLKLPFESRHVKQASETWQSDDIFRYVLAVLWESVAKPIICMLDLKVSLLLSQTLTITKVTIIYRNLMYHQIYGGALQGHLLFSQYMLQEYIVVREQSAFLIILFHHIHQPSVYCFVICPLLPTHLKLWL